ncbi:MAG: magnesium transporter [Planctomycetota bacterium]|nr:magnesium transporter [Planctomycetota bacterium]
MIDTPAMVSQADERVAELLEHSLDVPVLASAVEAQDPADAADTLETLEESEAADVLERMDLENAADALSHMVAPLAVSVLEDLVEEDPRFAARLVGEMPADDAADLLQFASDELMAAVLREMPARPRAVVEGLLAFDPDTAGGLMNPSVLEVRETMLVREAVEVIRDADPDAETEHVFVVDAAGRLTGIVGLRRLVIAQTHERIADICNRHVDAIRPDVDSEAVALEFEKYDHRVLPVVDARDHLLGVVTVDDVLDSIRAESTEDAQKMVGAGREEMVFSSVGDKLKGRLPWLVVNLLTSAIAALVVLQFEGLIAEVAVLAVLMPVIANQSGNAGQQSLAVTLRGIVLDQVNPKVAGRLLARESAVGLINGAIAGALVGGLVTVVSIAAGEGSWRLGAVIAASMTCSLTVGTFTGTVLPMLMRRFGADPATASTIFLTMVTDSLSFLIFLGMASALSGWIGLS